jgi:hypothetical protein
VFRSRLAAGTGAGRTRRCDIDGMKFPLSMNDAWRRRGSVMNGHQLPLPAWLASQVEQPTARFGLYSHPMRTNAFIGKQEPPPDDELSAALGSSKALWDQLLSELAAEYGLTACEWHSYSQKAGWALRVQRAKQNILYLSPFHGCFSVSFALGEKAVRAAQQSGLPRSVIRILDEARKYAEGTAVRLDVKRPEDIVVVKKLAVAKLEH